MKIRIIVLLCIGLIAAGCADSSNRSKGVYMLLDTSGTYAFELKKAQAIINYLLGSLQPNDTMAVASIDTGSFSEKDIIAKVTFDGRPSVANNQKRAFQQNIDGFVKNVKSSPTGSNSNWEASIANIVAASLPFTNSALWKNLFRVDLYPPCSRNNGICLFRLSLCCR